MTHEEAIALANQAERDLATCNYGICCVWPEQHHGKDTWYIVILTGLSPLTGKEHHIHSLEDYGVFHFGISLLSHFYIP